MTTDSNFTCIRNIKPGMKQLNIIFIVLEIGKPTTTKDGHTIRRVKVADKTGSVDLSVWDEYGAAMQTGDICKILKGYASIWKDSLTLYSGKGGEIQKIDDFCMAFVENPNMSEPNSDLVKQQRMNGGPPQPGGGGGQSQEQQPPPGGDGEGGGRGPARDGLNRGDPRSGAGKMTRNGGPGMNNAASGQNNHPHAQIRHKPYPAKKPLGSQNSCGNATAQKDSSGLQHGDHRGGALQGILKR